MPPKSQSPLQNLENLSFGSQQRQVARIVELVLSAIRPDPEQPRKHFDQEALESLSDSLKTHGLQQPIIVRPDPEQEGGFILVGGERRFRAAQLAGFDRIASVISRAGNHREIALIENLQREDLTPIEEAESFQRLIGEGHSQESVAKLVGKSRVIVNETLALLKLPAHVIEKARTLNIKRSVLAYVARMDSETQGEALSHAERKGALTQEDARQIKENRGRVATPAKLAEKALKATTERLEAIEGKLKIDELRTLREAKAKLDEIYKMVTSRKE